MKKCIHCGAEVPEEEAVCPACGQSVTEEAQTSENQQAQPETEKGPETDEDTCEEKTDPQEEGAQEPAAETPAAAAPAQKKPPVGVWIVGALAVVAIVAAILITGKKDQTPPADATQTGVTEQTEEEAAAEGETQEFVSYTATEDQLTDEVLARVVASCGGKELDNRMLDFYYWQQYYTLMSNYGSYASYFIDTSTPFDQQMCMFDDTRTWQQYFLQAAIKNYENVTAIWQEARLAGFQLSQEDQDYLDELDGQITVAAASYSYGSADEYLQMAYGPAATLTSYHAFVERQITASAYLQVLVDEKPYTEDDISKYYDDNADSYAGNGIEKTDVKMVNVRHILIQPEGKNDDGTYTDEAWAEAEKKANDLLTEWQNGEHTEDSFAFMAAENSQDPGSVENGGLYEDIYPGKMVDEFDAWCFDPARQPGDTGIVKTSYGYHIMYFSSTGEHAYWYVRAEEDYLNELSVSVLQEVAAKFEVTESEQNAAIVDIMQQN